MQNERLSGIREAVEPRLAASRGCHSERLKLRGCRPRQPPFGRSCRHLKLDEGRVLSAVPAAEAPLVATEIR
jgi:hypothetical protein